MPSPFDIRTIEAIGRQLAVAIKQPGVADQQEQRMARLRRLGILDVLLLEHRRIGLPDVDELAVEVAELERSLFGATTLDTSSS